MVAEARPALPTYLLPHPVKPLKALNSLKLASDRGCPYTARPFAAGSPATPELGSTCTP